MGSECNLSRRHYDLSMSKRTRKPTGETIRSPDQNGDQESMVPSTWVEGKDNGLDRRSLKELMEGEVREKHGEAKQCNSLAHHFIEEEKHLPLAKKQGDCLEGAKLTGMVNRYVKVLNHLIKVKRDSSLGSRKRAMIRLST
ncbi:uncharacterized protein LOC143859336 [Tasmannia lanceolata]|uniref:uncharacterized protein LOC143859336 n=1 Tax=Tasmannia lanceolata TaxID=3420 RepID=UPI0040636AF4